MIQILSDQAKLKNLNPVIACTEDSTASKRMIEKIGFKHIGLFNEIGFNFHAYKS